MLGGASSVRSEKREFFGRRDKARTEAISEHFFVRLPLEKLTFFATRRIEPAGLSARRAVVRSALA